MKTEKRIEQIEKTYWTCHIPEHRHVKEKTAKTCIIKRPHDAFSRESRRDILLARADRNIGIVWARLFGKKPKDIAKKSGITTQRAYQ